MSEEKQLLKRIRITHQSPGKFILYQKLDTQTTATKKQRKEARYNSSLGSCSPMSTAES